MSTKAQGINKRVAYKKETTWGTLAGAAGAQQVRRTSADFNLTKDFYSSEELRTDYQTADYRGGIRSADGTLNGELAPGAYSDFFGSVLARDFATVTPAAAVDDVTIAASGTNFTITRLAGSWLTDGIKVGNVIRLTGAGLSTATVGNNALVISASATVLTVKVLSGTAFVAEGPIAAVTATVFGKATYIPKTGHTDDSYTVEQWYADITQSEVFTGNKVGTANVSIPTTGFVTADFTFMGKDLSQTGAVEYFTTPTAAGTTGLLTAVQGALIINGQEGACVTDANISIERTLEPAQCIGSNSNSEIFVGRINVTGSLSAFFSDATLRGYFDTETPVTLVMAVTTGEEKDADFMTFVLPKIKLGSFNNADAETGIVSSVDFTALLNDVTTAGLIDSTIMIQDSQA